MTKSQKALIRQTTIWSRLNAGETVNVKALAEEFGVGVRTIQKDMNERLTQTYDIVDLGGGNYRFPEGYRFLGTEDEEAKIAVSLMKSLQHSAIPELDDLVEQALPSGSNCESMFLFDVGFEPIGDIGLLKVLIQAIRWKVGVEFTYTPDPDKPETIERAADPYRIANYERIWYLIAYDAADERLRAFHLSRISRLRTLYENFIGNPTIEAELEARCDRLNPGWFDGEW
jgi:predicted DNA-binding transcriptional regulator YafY